jgi:hypothetical protein
MKGVYPPAALEDFVFASVTEGIKKVMPQASQLSLGLKLDCRYNPVPSSLGLERQGIYWD